MLRAHVVLLALSLGFTTHASAQPVPAGSGVSSAARATVQRTVSTLRQAAESVIVPHGEQAIGAHDRAAITAQRLSDVLVALHELPLPAQATAQAKLKSGSAFAKGVAQGLLAYRTARQKAAGDPGKLARAQSALKLGLSRLVVDGDAKFAELAAKDAGDLTLDPEPVLRRADTLKPERWVTLKKDVLAVTEKLETVAQ